MKPEYLAFRDELCEARRAQYHPSDRAGLTTADLVRAACNDFTTQFAKKFPHLKRQAGFYGAVEPDVENMTATEHWWLVDVDGTIVDPTAEQFRPGGTYTPFDPGKHRIKIGWCINCGWDIFGLRSEGARCVCSKDCEKALEREYG